MQQHILFRSLSHHLLILALLLPVSGSYAAEAGAEEAARDTVQPTPALTLPEVITDALQRDPNGVLTEAYLAEARALDRHASSLIAGNPVVALNYQSDQTRSDQGFREWEGSLELPLWHFGQRSASRDVATRATEAATAAGSVQRLKVSGAVRESLWELTIAQERRTLAEQSLQTARQLEQDVEKRVTAGDLAKSDLLLARDETLSKQDEFYLADAEWLHAQKRYRMLTGLAEYPASFSELLTEQTSIDDSHPLLAETRARMEQAQAELRRAEQSSSDNTQLIVGTRHTRDDYNSEMVDSLGVGVRIPIGTRSHNGPRISAASTAFAESQARYQRTQRELELALHEAHHNLETLREQLQLADEQNTLGQESLRMARIAFRTGEIELAQLLRIQSRAFNAERNLALRKLEVEQAVARYNQAIGVTP
ncbi:MAG TPA: TolC family protein [Gammaproteobacteria bacterium]